MRWRLLGHPYFTGAVAVMAVNDHVLKARLPSPATGKLSDFAGVFVGAVALSALSGRPRLACSVTGLAFVALKTVHGANLLAAPILGGVTRRDPTDLVSLLMLYPAFRFAESRLPPVHERPILQQALAIASALVAVIAMSATGCLPRPEIDAFVRNHRGAVFARVNADPYNRTQTPRWAVSDDGGATWRSSTEDLAGRPVLTDKEVCSQSLGCFRLKGESVQHSPNPSAAFDTSFGFTKEQRKQIEQRAVNDCGVRISSWFSSLAVVVRPDGEHVVVAMGAQGALHRAPDGRWTRVAVLDLKPVPLGGPSWLLHLDFTPLVLLALSPSALLLGSRRRWQDRGRTAFAVALTGSFGIVMLAGVMSFLGVDYVITGPLVATLSVGVVVASVVVTILQGRTGGKAPEDDADVISAAMVLWTGWGESSWPSRDDDRVVSRYGEDLALALLPVLRGLATDFYASDAKDTASGLQEMGDAAAAQFRTRHPEISEAAVQALAWCYTYDHK
jgi:hypothetical protein